MRYTKTQQTDTERGTLSKRVPLAPIYYDAAEFDLRKAIEKLISRSDLPAYYKRSQSEVAGMLLREAIDRISSEDTGKG